MAGLFHHRGLSRRGFLQSTAGTALAATALPSTLWAEDGKIVKADPESTVGRLFNSLTAEQKKNICFDWNHQDPQRGLLRTFIANNWNITRPEIKSDFYAPEQRAIIREIFEGIIQPDWHARIDQQMTDDSGGFGHDQSIAIFGDPSSDQFEFVLTGRHMTLRCDGNSAPHVAFGGPIFYGHAANGFDEEADHPGNVFWPQAEAANRVAAMLSGRQQQQALLPHSPEESAVGFGGQKEERPGLPVGELSDDQQEEMQKVLAKLIEPYRQVDQEEVRACLKAQGGLDACHLAFYRDADIGEDGVWDNWRLEGPAFVWYFRGSPHVHVWVNIADDPRVALNA
jgi:hypothetical protein